MRRASRTTGVAIAVVVIGLGIAGCGSDGGTEGTTAPVTTPSPGAAPPEGAPPASPTVPSVRPRYTIVDFIRDNRIAETQLHRGQPGAPIVNMPTPPGWADAGDRTPAWAWGAIFFTDPAMAADPPNIVTLVSKLAGTGVGRALSYAPGELRNMTDFQGDEGTSKKVSGFDAFTLGGTFTRDDGVKRAIVQTTVLFPAPDGVFIMQHNADGPPGQLQFLRDTLRVIDEQTTITPP